MKCKMRRKVSFFFFFSRRNFPRKLEIDDAAIKRNVFKLARRFLIYTLMIFLID